MKKLFWGLLTLVALFAASCGESNIDEPIDNPVFESNGSDYYIIEAKGGEINIKITTNIEYSVNIPIEAQSWVSIADTRALSREENITFTVAVNDSFDERSTTVELVDGDGEVLQTISFVQDGQTETFNCDSDDRYIVNADGGEINIKITTNIEYSVNIPIEAQSWVSIADTRALPREDTLIFIIAKNEAYERRKTSVELICNDGVVLQTIKFDQRATKHPDLDCPTDEIWYTADEEAKLHYDDEYAFGANVVSNVWDAATGKGIISFDGVVTKIGTEAFLDCDKFMNITIPDSVTMIGDGAFSGCTSLTNITIPDSVTTIGKGVFRGCTSLTNITISDSVTSIGICVFYKCSSLTSVTIPDSVTSIGAEAFFGCSSLTSITIPSSVNEIGKSTFYGCKSLTSITIPDGVTIIRQLAFGHCASLTNITIPDSVNTIEEQAFVGCSSMVEFSGKFASDDGRCIIIDSTILAYAHASGNTYTIPDNATVIGAGVFSDCSSLTSVTIPDSVTSIEGNAFYDCSSLTTVTIPFNVTTIGIGAFYGCSGLKKVYCRATTPPVLGYQGFDENPSNRRIIVPIGSGEAYKTATQWKKYASSIFEDEL